MSNKKCCATHQFKTALNEKKQAKIRTLSIFPLTLIYCEVVLNLLEYLPILLFLVIGVLVGVVPMLIGKVLSPSLPDAEKLSTYECGFEPFEDARMQFDIRYYLVAILFILFDLEIAFLFPWAVAFKDLDFFGLISMMIFLGILVVGFVYEWAKGALDWE